jgi:hypothetical protein
MRAYYLTHGSAFLMDVSLFDVLSILVAILINEWTICRFHPYRHTMADLQWKLLDLQFEWWHKCTGWCSEDH